MPDHVLVRQTVTDCLTEPLDAAGLVALLEELESGRIDVHLVESAEPSPLAHGILTGRPFTFLDGAPLEERRTRAVPVPRGLGPDGPPRPAGGGVGARAPRRRGGRRRSSTRSAPGPATPTSCTTCCCRWSCADRCRPGSRGSTR